MTACPACRGRLAPWRSLPAGEPSDPRRFDILRCERCGTRVTGGEPPGAEAYETGVYDPRAPRAGRLVRAVQATVDAQPVRLLRRAGVDEGARVLDLGAGRGRLVARLRGAGLDARGLEPSTRGAEAAVAAGLPVERAAIESHTDEGLDAAVLWHVVEHLDDPAAALARVAGWLRPGGVLLVAVPNADSLQARIAGERWLHWDLPRHRLHLTPAGLRELLESAGLRPTHTAHMVWEHNPASMWMALLSRLGMSAGFPFHLLKRNVRARPRDVALLALGVPLLPVALGLEIAAAAARRGGTIAQLAVRV